MSFHSSATAGEPSGGAGRHVPKPLSLRRVASAGAAALLACRPAAAPPAPEPRGGPIYLVTPDRLYTTAPVGEGISFAPVVEKQIERRAGAVTMALSYPEIDLPDDDRERELADAIREAGELKKWAALAEDDHVGAVRVACAAPLSTTAIVSVACERLDTRVTRAEARAGTGSAAAAAIVAASYDVSAAPIRPLTWDELLRPGVGPAQVLDAALAGAGDETRDAWLSGQCSGALPDFTVDLEGLEIWPASQRGACRSLRLGREHLLAVVVPNGLVARVLRLGQPEEEAPPDAPLPAQPPPEP